MAESGSLEVVIRLGDEHGGVFTYDSRIDSSLFGLVVTLENEAFDLSASGSTMVNVPSEGFLMYKDIPKIGTNGLNVVLSLKCKLS